jgi:hypothetical protein
MASGPAPARPQPMTCAIGLFKISSTLVVDPSVDRLPQLGQPVPVDELIGQQVQKLDWRGRHLATITRLFGSVRVVHPSGGQALRYYDAVELEPKNPQTFGISGDGGALVLTENDEPLGILIAGSDRRYFVAPMLPILTNRQLHLLTLADAAIHNKNALALIAKKNALALAGASLDPRDGNMTRYIAELGHQRGKQEELNLLAHMASSLPLHPQKRSALADALEDL